MIVSDRNIELAEAIEKMLSEDYGYDICVYPEDVETFEDNPEDLFDEVIEDLIMEYIDYSSEVVYYSDALETLSDKDPSLQYSLELANERGYALSQLNSCILASLIIEEEKKEEYYDNKESILEDIKQLYEQNPIDHETGD
ncbi:MAG: hypothetical protein D6732_00215 [Methanobacteriota archaeon]|nr:MAG: hypothetical protein D6732_00215 [Euryarchaeota archaeon]